jgi:hypothetical protein
MAAKPRGRAGLLVSVPILIAGLTGLPADARGGPPEHARMAARARAEAKAGRFQAAFDLYENALRLEPRPEYLHNAAVLLLVGLERPLQARQYALRFAAASAMKADLATANALIRECEQALAKSHGRIVARVEPASATAWIDDRNPEARVEAGGSWCTPGSHRLIVEAPNHETREEPFEVRAGGEVQVKVVLAVRKAEIRAECAVPACSLSVNDERLGQGPVDRQVAPGSYRIRAEAEGYLPVEELVTLRPGESRVTRLAPTLLPVATLSVRCDATPCDVQVDGTHAGTAPIRIPLKSGAHRVKAIAEGRTPFEQEVLARPGGDVFVTATLQPIAKPVPLPRPHRTWAWIAIGGGSALAATGALLVGLGYREAGIAQGIDELDYPDYAAYRSAFNGKARAARTKAYTGWVLLGSGLAAVGAGIVLHRVTPDGPVSATITPAFLQDGAGLSATAAW